MKAKREQQSPPVDMERFRKELGLKIQRLVAESLEAWSTCDNCNAAARSAAPARIANAPANGALRCRRFRRRKRSNGWPISEENWKFGWPGCRWTNRW
jgi:hypothetical protein